MKPFIGAVLFYLLWAVGFIGFQYMIGNISDSMWSWIAGVFMGAFIEGVMRRDK